jgi:uncharacterized protein YdeI (YjbR/CyaY-like superfamily)
VKRNKKMAEEIKTCQVSTRKEWKAWLKKNHKKETNACVILYKRHTGKSAPTHRELIEEAICFGWIDTTVKRLDEDRYTRRFSKRNKNSKWSNNTLRYAKQMIKEKKMTAEGLKFYELGLKKPTHDHSIPKNPLQPLELKKELTRNKSVLATFTAFSPSKKKMLYRWILSGKLPETRKKRVKKIYDAVKNGSDKII